MHCKPVFIDSRAASCSRLVEPSDGSESISVSISLIFLVIIVLNKDDKTSRINVLCSTVFQINRMHNMHKLTDMRNKRYGSFL